MSRSKKWTDRKFDFDFTEDESLRLIGRLRATPNRLNALLVPVPETVLVRRDGESWSIQENAGHLEDTDRLFITRLEEYKAGASRLSPAEMSGRKTIEANHNESDLETVLENFRKQRDRYIDALQELSGDMFGRSAYHPRLEKEMRLCDMLHFQAEHDAYHIRRIEELLARFTE